MSGTPSNPVRITWHNMPPSPAQLVAWRQLWARLLGDVDPGPETAQPQEVSPGANTIAAVASGSYTWSERHDDSTASPDSQ